MKALGLLLALIVATAAAAKEAAPLAADPVLDARVMHLAGELRCLVCQNETLADSQADLAVDLRRRIGQQLAEGRSDAQVVDDLVARYGAFVRYRPAFDATTALLWTGPFALLAVGGVLLARTLRGRRALPDAAVIDDGPGVPPPRAIARPRRTGIVIAAGMLVFAGCVYAAIGNPAAVGAAAPVADATGDDDVDPMLAAMAAKLATPSADPAADAQGWAMLGRSYAALQRFAEADRAFVRAVALAPADAALLVDRADVLAALQSGAMAGVPERLVDQALVLDPRNLKALALAGTAAFERHDVDTARDRWRSARDLAPAGSAFVAGLERSLADLPGAADSAARVSGRVDLDPALAARLSPDDVVFITARAVDGPRMPLAVLRRRVADLPIAFTLDDSLAMSAAARLSSVARVIVTARVSAGGEAIAQAGDARADSAPVAVGTTGVQLTLASPGP